MGNLFWCSPLIQTSHINFHNFITSNLIFFTTLTDAASMKLRSLAHTIGSCTIKPGHIYFKLIKAVKHNIFSLFIQLYCFNQMSKRNCKLRLYFIFIFYVIKKLPAPHKTPTVMAKGPTSIVVVTCIKDTFFILPIFFISSPIILLSVLVVVLLIVQF